MTEGSADEEWKSEKSSSSSILEFGWVKTRLGDFSIGGGGSGDAGDRKSDKRVDCTAGKFFWAIALKGGGDGEASLGKAASFATGAEPVGDLFDKPMPAG